MPLRVLPVRLIPSLLIALLLVLLPPRQVSQAAPSKTLPTDATAEQPVAQTTSPAQLELLSYMLGPALKVVANETTAVVLTTGELVLLDLRNPTNPQIVSRLLLQKIYPNVYFQSADLALADHYVFVTCAHCGATQLFVVNVAVPTTPVVVGTMAAPQHISRIKAAGDILLIALLGGEIGLVDISNPTAPILLDTHRLNGHFGNVHAIAPVETSSGRYSFITHDGQLSIFKITNNRSLEQVGSYVPEQLCMTEAALMAQGDQLNLYVTGCGGDLRVLDVTFPPQPRARYLHRFGPDQKISGITAVDDRLWVTTAVESDPTWDATLHIMEPASAALTEVAAYREFVSVAAPARSGALYIFIDDRGIALLDHSDPTALSEVGRQINVTAYSDIDSDGDYLYLADWDGFKVIDATNPAAPAYAAEVAMPHALNIEVEGGYALATDFYGGLWIFDLHQPTEPTIVSHSTIPLSVTTDIVLSGTLGTAATAFIGGGPCTEMHLFGCPPSSLIAVDLQDLQNPTATIFLADERGVADMAQAGDYLFVTTGSPGLLSISELLVFDIVNPQLPIQVDQITLTASVSSLAVVGDALYIALTDALQTYDISNPVVPLLKDTLPLSRPFHSISVDSGFLYGQDGAQLTLISLVEPFQPVLIERQPIPAYGAGIVAANAIFATDGFVYVLNSGLTIWRHQHDLIGRVFDAWGEPQSGVRIDGRVEVDAAGAGAGATSFTFSGFHGSYARPKAPTGTLTGAITLQPIADDAHFWPPLRTGVTPETEARQDFYRLPQPVSTTVAAGAATTLSYIDGRDLTTTVTLPADAVAPAAVVQLEPIMAFAQDDAHFTGNAFALQVVGSAAETITSFSAPVTLTIHYSEQGANALLAEKHFHLRIEQEGRWQVPPAAARAQALARSPTSNVLTFAIGAAGRYALFGKTNPLYFPLMRQ